MRTRQMFRNSVRALGLSAAFIGALASSAFALTLNVTDDTFTDNQRPHPLGAEPVILIGNVSGRNLSGFVRFNLAPLPTGATITNAFLRLYVNDVENLVGPAATINIFELNGAWTEGTLTTANIPPKFPTPMFTVSVAPSNENTFILVDVTQAVKDWQSGARANNGLTLVPSASSAMISLDSKENTKTSHPMELEVVIAATGATGPQGPAGPQGPVGPQGVAGATGAKGDTGATGATGAAGPKGDQGIQGLPGASGAGFGLIQGSGPPSASQNQGTLYWNNVDFSLWEYTGVGNTTTATMIATGNDVTTDFTSVSANFTILPAMPNIGPGQIQAPPPATTAFQVVYSRRSRELWVANTNLVWQLVGNITP